MDLSLVVQLTSWKGREGKSLGTAGERQLAGLLQWQHGRWSTGGLEHHDQGRLAATVVGSDDWQRLPPRGAPGSSSCRKLLTPLRSEEIFTISSSRVSKSTLTLSLSLQIVHGCFSRRDGSQLDSNTLIGPTNSNLEGSWEKLKNMKIRIVSGFFKKKRK